MIADVFFRPGTGTSEIQDIGVCRSWIIWCRAMVVTEIIMEYMHCACSMYRGTASHLHAVVVKLAERTEIPPVDFAMRWCWRWNLRSMICVLWWLELLLLRMKVDNEEGVFSASRQSPAKARLTFNEGQDQQQRSSVLHLVNTRDHLSILESLRHTYVHAIIISIS